MSEICEQYIKGTLNPDRVFIGIIDINVDRPYTVGACHARKDMIAGPDVHDIARMADHVIRKALPNSDPAILVTSAQYVVSVDYKHRSKSGNETTVVQHTDDREVKERRNRSRFDRNMWLVQSCWRLKSWSWPRFALYDYDGHDGRKVWSWVFHIGPWWIVRQRYAL